MTKVGGDAGMPINATPKVNHENIDE